MKKIHRKVDRFTNEDTARMQAMWTGIVLAMVIFVALFFYFSEKQAKLSRDVAITVAHDVISARSIWR